MSAADRIIPVASLTDAQDRMRRRTVAWMDSAVVTPFYEESEQGRFRLRRFGVTAVDVVELEPDVVDLVGRYYSTESRVAFHVGDAYTHRFPPGTTCDVAWHDIWDNISSDNDFATLHRRYGRRVRWQGSWCRDEALEADRRWRRENAHWIGRS